MTDKESLVCPSVSDEPGQAALAAFVRRLSSHSPLSGRERALLCELPFQSVEISANRDFVKLGDLVEHACLIVEGLVGKYGQTWEGERQIVSLHIPGEMVDLPSVVAPQSTTSLTALTASTLFKVRHRDVRELSFHHPAIAVAFWRACVLDGAIVAQWLVNVGRRDARARLAHLFCEMSVRYRMMSQSNGCLYELPMSQEQLGDALGLTSVHVNRTLQSLREEGLIVARRGHIEILDWNALVEVAEFDIAYLLPATGHIA